jgi:heterodisulfide reductase subunit B
MNLEAYQGKVNAKFGTEFKLPVLFFTQLVGLALGVNPDELGFRRQLIPFEPRFMQVAEA